MFKIEVVVIGAGVIGLAIARALSLRGCHVLVLERERGIGLGTSSRNSEVIHAGLYYEPQSLKARLCVRGRHMLYQYVRERHVPHRQCGKLVVATSESEETHLDQLRRRAKENGVDELELIGRTGLIALEPELRGSSALVSPCSGILDSHALLLAYQADAEALGCTFAFRTPVLKTATVGRKIQLRIGGIEPTEVEAEFVVNSAGLDAWELSSRLDGLDPNSIPAKYLAKGNYFSLTGVRAPFRHLIYPIPEPGGLGIHLTLDLAGEARFGPDVEWVDQVDYHVDPLRCSSFYHSIRRYWPNLADGSLVPAYSGIRPKTTSQNQAPGDFVIQGPAQTGHPGYICLYGIESPGLTASLAIGEWVAQLALD
jgi:L-2-hydroxyglutarate oxidase LhgO